MSATSSASDGGGGKIGGKPGKRCQKVGAGKALDDGPAGEGRLGIGPAPCLKRAWLGPRTAKGGALL